MPKYKDLNINFTKNDFTDDVNIAKDLDAIRQSVTNLCLFWFGDKPFVSVETIGERRARQGQTLSGSGY